MHKLMYLWLAVKTVLCSCQPDHKENGFSKVRSDYKISKAGKLPSVADESSGLANGTKPGTFWTHNDSGGNPELYEINEKGKLLSTRQVRNARNIDWEDLAEDHNRNLYIGDFGNNSNKRKTLDIYKLSATADNPEKITFRYQNQTAFPPPADEMNYDCEAFFHFNNHVYLFSKNRSKGNDKVFMYQLSDQPGSYSTVPADSININSQVTSADISPDGRTFALLTYGKILLFAVEDGTINFKHPTGCFKIVKKQAEALLFLNNTDMLITNEQGQIYRVTHR
jgi:hypothetical protein